MQDNFGFNHDKKTEDNSAELLNSDKDLTCSRSFWFADDNYFRSTLIISPARQDAHNRHIINVFDMSGEQVNQIQVKFPSNKPGLIDLDGLCQSCQFLAGVRSGSVQVVSAIGTKVACDIKAVDNNLIVTNDFELTRGNAVFFPLHFANDSKQILAFNSFGIGSINLKIRLFTETRSPEIELKIKSREAKHLLLEDVFANYLELTEESKRAYIRILPYSGEECYVRFIENKRERKYFNNSENDE